MASITHAIAVLGSVIALLASELASMALTASTKVLAVTATGADWLALKLEAAQARLQARAAARVAA